MQKPLIVLLTCLLISGCATKAMQDNLHYLQGKDIEVAIYYLGIPDNQFEIKDHDVYIWSHQNSGSYVTPVTNTSDYHGNSVHHGYGVFGGFGTTFGSVSTTSYVNQGYNHFCTIKALTDRQNIVQQISFDGNDAGCRVFSNSMSAIARDYKPNPENISNGEMHSNSFIQ